MAQTTAEKHPPPHKHEPSPEPPSEPVPPELPPYEPAPGGTGATFRIAFYSKWGQINISGRV